MRGGEESESDKSRISRSSNPSNDGETTAAESRIYGYCSIVGDDTQLRAAGVPFSVSR